MPAAANNSIPAPGSGLVRRICRLLAALAVSMFAMQSPAQATDRVQVLQGFGASSATDGRILAIAGPDANGITYVGGRFNRYNVVDTGPGALVSGSDGAVNMTFPKIASSGGSSSIYAAVADGSGGYYIGGAFTTVDGTTRNNAAHINSDGSLDSNWNPNVNGAVYAIAVAGSSVYLGGSFTTVNGSTTRNRAAKVDTTNGTVDTSWNPNLNNAVQALVVSGSSVYLGGDFNGANSVNGNTTRNYAAKVSTTNGTVDSSWNPTLNSTLSAIAIDGSSVYLGGSFTTVNGSTTRNRAAKVDTTNGTVNGSWNPNLNNSIVAIAVSGSNVYLGGSFTTVNGSTTRNRAAKVDTTNGTVDGSWNPNVSGVVRTIAISGASAFLGGDFNGANSVNGNRSLNYAAKVDTTNGTVDTGWAVANLDQRVYVLAPSGSNVYVGGGFTRAGGYVRNNAAAFDSSGNITAWNPNVSGEVTALAVSGSSVYLGGSFNGANSVNGTTTRNGAAKVDTANGTVDSSWDPNLGKTVCVAPPGDPFACGFGPPGPDTPSVSAIGVRGSNVYLGGSFDTVNGSTARVNVAKVNSTDGTADSSWNLPLEGNSKSVNAITVSGSDVYIGGSFSVVKYNDSTGQRDETWAPDIGASVTAIAVDGSNVYIAGNVALGLDDYASLHAIARINAASGAVDSSWLPSLTGNVKAIGVDDNHVYVGGWGSSMTVGLAVALDKDSGAANAGYSPTLTLAPAGFNASVSALKVIGSRVYIGGWFVGGLTTTGLAPAPVAAPTITDGPAAASLSTLTSASFSFSTSTSGAGFQCQIDSQPTASCSSPQSYSGLSDGEHTFKVYATKTGSVDSSVVTRSWTVDTAAPSTPGSFTGVPSSPTNQTGATIGFALSESGGTVECRLDSGSWGACTSVSGTGGSMTVSGLADGSHGVSVRQTDAAGNVSAVGTSASWTVDTVKPGKPVLSGAPSSPTTSTSQNISWGAVSDASGIARYECSTDGASYATCTSPQTRSGIAVGSRGLAVRAVDNAGNVGDPQTASWTVQAAVVPVAAPTILTPSAGTKTVYKTTVDGKGTWAIKVGLLFSTGSDTRGSAQFLTVQVAVNAQGQPVSVKPSDSLAPPTAATYANGVSAWSSTGEVNRTSVAQPVWVRVGNKAGKWSAWVRLTA